MSSSPSFLSIAPLDAALQDCQNQSHNFVRFLRTSRTTNCPQRQDIPVAAPATQADSFGLQALQAPQDRKTGVRLFICSQLKSFMAPCLNKDKQHEQRWVGVQMELEGARRTSEAGHAGPI